MTQNRNYTTPRIVAFLIVLFAAALVVNSALAGDAPVTVYLANGKTLTAFVDTRTNEDRVWLRYGNGAITIVRPLAWQAVIRAQTEDVKLDSAEFCEWAMSQRSAQPTQPSAFSDPSALAADRAKTSDLEDFGKASHASRARTALGAAPRLVSVRFDARLANWDRDAEPDGLLLDVQPLDSDGRLTPVRGTLHVEVVTLGLRSARDASRRGGLSTTTIASWTKSITDSDVKLGGARFKLPFQARNPEFDLSFDSQAVVYLRLTVPGHGVFESTQNAVRIRRIAPLRGELKPGLRSR